MKSRTTDPAILAGLDFGGGSGAAYDETGGYCVRCGSKIRLRIETDGNGHLVETPGPCRACGRGVHTAFGLPFVRSTAQPKIAPASKPAPRACRAEVRAAILRGTPASAIMREVGVSRQSVYVVRRALEAEGKTLTCRCGKPAFHRGRCRGKERVT